MSADRVTTARRRVSALIRIVDHTLGRGLGRRRVLVDVRTPMNAVVLRPVWSALHRDRRICLSFTAEDATGVSRLLRREGLEHALLDRERATWRRFDLALTADAWNHTPLRRCRARLAFFHGVAGKYDLDRPERLARAELHTFDRVGFINEERLQRYVSAGTVRPEQAVLIGYPKLDALMHGQWRAADVRASLGLPPSVPTVLYAPTFSTASSLHRAGLEIVETLLADGLNVMVKLHDRSLVPHDVYTAGIDWRARLSHLRSRRQFALVDDADATPYLAAADVLVTDHSTVGFEFALLDRPIVVFDVPNLRRAARIDAAKWELLRAMATVVDSPADMVHAVKDALTCPDRLRGPRTQARPLFAHVGEATGRALTLVYDLLDLPPTTGAVTISPSGHDRLTAVHEIGGEGADARMA